MKTIQNTLKIIQSVKSGYTIILTYLRNGAYLRRKHGSNVHKVTAAILALLSAPAMEAALYTF